jgi:putative phage-type endonuclease
MTDSAFDVLGDSSHREEWLKMRRSGIGGSDAPAILGLVPWASPTSVQMDKWGLADEPDEAEVVRWGRRLESVIAAGLGEDEGWDLEPYGLLIRSRSHPWMLCTPDTRRRSDGVFVQIKNTMKADDWNERVPEAVVVQCQHEMAVTGHARCIAAALVLGNRLRWAYVERDEPFIEHVLIPAERAFWEATQSMEPVAADGSEHTKRAYGRLWPQDSGETIALDGQFIDLDFERGELQGIVKTAQTRLDAIDNELRLAMKSATYAVLPNGVRYSLRAQTRKAHTVNESTFRVLRRSK